MNENTVNIEVTSEEQALLVGYLLSAKKFNSQSWIPSLDPILTKLEKATNKKELIHSICLAILEGGYSNIAALDAFVLIYTILQGDQYNLISGAWELKECLQAFFPEGDPLWKHITITEPPPAETVLDILGLVLEEKELPSLETIQSWTQAQKDEAVGWAGAVHLNASDNWDVIVPPKPEFLS